MRQRSFVFVTPEGDEFLLSKGGRGRPEGYVSHRKDGDYRKKGKDWVKVAEPQADKAEGETKKTTKEKTTKDSGSNPPKAELNLRERLGGAKEVANKVREVVQEHGVKGALKIGGKKVQAKVMESERVQNAKAKFDSGVGKVMGIQDQRYDGMERAIADDVEFSRNADKYLTYCTKGVVRNMINAGRLLGSFAVAGAYMGLDKITDVQRKIQYKVIEAKMATAIGAREFKKLIGDDWDSDTGIQKYIDQTAKWHDEEVRRERSKEGRRKLVQEKMPWLYSTQEEEAVGLAQIVQTTFGAIALSPGITKGIAWLTAATTGMDMTGWAGWLTIKGASFAVGLVIGSKIWDKYIKKIAHHAAGIGNLDEAIVGHLTTYDKQLKGEDRKKLEGLKTFPGDRSAILDPVLSEVGEPVYGAALGLGGIAAGKVGSLFPDKKPKDGATEAEKDVRTDGALAADSSPAPIKEEEEKDKTLGLGGMGALAQKSMRFLDLIKAESGMDSGVDDADEPASDEEKAMVKDFLMTVLRPMMLSTVKEMRAHLNPPSEQDALEIMESIKDAAYRQFGRPLDELMEEGKKKLKAEGKIKDGSKDGVNSGDDPGEAEPSPMSKGFVFVPI